MTECVADVIGLVETLFRSCFFWIWLAEKCLLQARRSTRHLSLTTPYSSSHDLIMGSMPFRFSLHLVPFQCDAEGLYP